MGAKVEKYGSLVHWLIGSLVHWSGFDMKLLSTFQRGSIAYVNIRNGAIVSNGLHYCTCICLIPCGGLHYCTCICLIPCGGLHYCTCICLIPCGGLPYCTCIYLIPCGGLHYCTCICLILFKESLQQNIISVYLFSRKALWQ